MDADPRIRNRPTVLADLAGQRGLSGLPGTDDGDRRLTLQSVQNSAA